MNSGVKKDISMDIRIEGRAYLSIAVAICSVISLQAWNSGVRRRNEQREQSSKNIHASNRKDPGLKEIFHTFEDELQKHGKERMENLRYVRNEGQVKSTDSQHPAAKELLILKAGWRLGDKPRNYVLIIEDMEKEYRQYIDYTIPAARMLLDKFRALQLPVVWTNWAKRLGDKSFGAVDRFYGPQGIEAKENPAYVYLPRGEDTVEELAPQSENEQSRTIQSLHLSKFADLDENGREILFPMLQSWGVNTIVLIGAWTDDCIAATVFDAVDRYGYDVVLVTDALATATVHGNKMLECLSASVAVPYTAASVCSEFEEHPHLIQAPRGDLNGQVRFNSNNLVAIRT